MKIPTRMPLLDERRSITYKFTILSTEGEKKFYVTLGMYKGEEGRLGEIFITTGKEGSFISAALDLLATVISVALQFGVPLQAFTKKMRHVQCEPCGTIITTTPPGLCSQDGSKFFAKSPFDFIAALLDHEFPDGLRRKA
jgi:ribonucleoside-diphosphate reductase alpha chain